MSNFFQRVIYKNNKICPQYSGDYGRGQFGLLITLMIGAHEMCGGVGRNDLKYVSTPS